MDNPEDDFKEQREKLRLVVLKLFGFDSNQPRPKRAEKFVWPWKSPKPVIRVYATTGEIVPPKKEDPKDPEQT